MFATPNRSISTRNVFYTGRSRSPGYPRATDATGRSDYWGETMASDASSIYPSSNVSSLDVATSKYLKRPVQPRPSKSPQFHRPTRNRSPSSDRYRSISCGPRRVKSGMLMLVEQLHLATPRSRSPNSVSQEPVELSHYPDGRRLRPDETLPIERDDFPAPPYPFVDHAHESYKKITRLHHLTAPSSKSTSISAITDVIESPRSIVTSHLNIDRDSTGEAGGSDYSSDIDYDVQVDPKLKKEREELSKINSSMSKVFLKGMKEREKLNIWKKEHLDPRKSSRTASAAVEANRKLRYNNPVHASPSRDLDRTKPWEEDSELHLVPVYRSHPSGTGAPVYPMPVVNRQVVSSLSDLPKPGYGLRALTLPTCNNTLSPAITSSTIVNETNYFLDRDNNVSNNMIGSSNYSTFDCTKETITLPSLKRVEEANKTTAGSSMTLPSTLRVTSNQGYRRQQQQNDKTCHLSQYINATPSSDISSSRSDYSIHTSDLYTANDRRRYVAATGVQPEWLRYNTNVSKDTTNPGRIIPIDYSDGPSGRSSSFGGRRSITPGGRSSSAASGYHTGNFTASSTYEPNIYVSTIEHHVKDYQTVDTRETLVHSSTSGYPSISTCTDQPAKSIDQTFQTKLSPSLPNEIDNLSTSYREPSNQIVKQRQYKLMTQSTTVNGDDKNIFATELAAHLRRSMPNVNMHLNESDCVPVYPYCVLETRNYRFPPNVDRCHLERHLSTDEFIQLFQMSRMEFYRLPDWRRNELKKRVRLF